MLLNCKFCGGELEITEGTAVAECKYCRTKQTLPKAEDEGLHNLFNRANALRRRCEFDKAETAFEKIIEADGEEAEAYYGLVLSKYGIEYVEDPATGKMLPTCHRASYDSLVADEDYKSALEYADGERRAIYEEQAREIDRIQKEILALAQKEETYDVFICYKETDENGRRTRDSVIANEIYYQLTDAGLKVFYAAVTLENKLGRDYEPIIFAALNSAKVMLVVGSKPEYFNAVWVKNEWSRYLKIMKKDRKKLLIPCYRDMDAYDLPDEFAHLQAQNMEKIGFITDLIRGVKKVMEGFKDKQPAVIKETVKETVVKEKPVVIKDSVVSGGVGTASLLRRVFVFLEDGDFKSADEYCERVLDIELENADAYIGKLMAELKIKKREQLKDVETPFDSDINYKKAIRYGDEALKKELEIYISEINTRNEIAIKESVYQEALENYKCYELSKMQNAKAAFESISDYKDSAELARSCDKLIKDIKEKERIESEQREVFARIEAKKRQKRLIIAIICVSVFFVMCFVSGIIFNSTQNSSEADEAENLKFTISSDGKSYSVTGIGECTATDIYIPDTYLGKPVTSISYMAFHNCQNIETVRIPDSITSIGKYAFSGCDSLKKITFDDDTSWYRTKEVNEFTSKNGGHITQVSNASTTAKLFTETYKDSFWYKK